MVRQTTRIPSPIAAAQGRSDRLGARHWRICSGVLQTRVPRRGDRSEQDGKESSWRPSRLLSTNRPPLPQSRRARARVDTGRRVAPPPGRRTPASVPSLASAAVVRDAPAPHRRLPGDRRAGTAGRRGGGLGRRRRRAGGSIPGARAGRAAASLAPAGGAPAGLGFNGLGGGGARVRRSPAVAPAVADTDAGRRAPRSAR